MSSKKTLIEKYNSIQKIGTEVEVPFNVWRALSEQELALQIMGNEVCLGGDYVSLSEAREALTWYVKQMGGTVQWSFK